MEIALPNYDPEITKPNIKANSCKSDMYTLYVFIKQFAIETFWANPNFKLIRKIKK